jgi:hypothetical protein
MRRVPGAAVPVTVFRAAMIIGSGSASFEILRYLVERLPVMVTPRWVQTESQPIAVRNVLEYLVRSLATPATAGRTLDIGGPDVLSYRDLMQVMAECRGLRRRIIVPVPVLTPRLSSLWIHLVTPVNHRIARPLAEGLRNRVVCRDDEATRLIPQRLLGVREAITERTYHALCRVGGGRGYYAANWLWRLRGTLDRLAGGPGLRRGRRDPETVVFGDALDFWRVTAAEPGRRLDLRAEMKLPGEALLSFSIVPIAAGRCRLTQTARFKPRGLAGLAYWYGALPFHAIVFSGMLEGIRRYAEARRPTA